jgi:acylphosphatase
VTSLDIRIHGKVQGVFYRDWTVATARALGVAGWVKNRPDGTVGARLEGEAEAVRRMVERMHEGPPRARVDRIDQRPCNPEGLDSFERR